MKVEVSGEVRGKRILQLAAVAGWLALLVSMTPWGDPFGFELGRAGIALGPTCSVVLALRRLALPVLDVFEAGRALGRHEASPPQRPHLRVVDGD